MYKKHLPNLARNPRLRCTLRCVNTEASALLALLLHHEWFWCARYALPRSETVASTSPTPFDRSSATASEAPHVRSQTRAVASTESSRRGRKDRVCCDHSGVSVSRNDLAKALRCTNPRQRPQRNSLSAVSAGTTSTARRLRQNVPGAHTPIQRLQQNVHSVAPSTECRPRRVVRGAVCGECRERHEFRTATAAQPSCRNAPEQATFRTSALPK